MPDGKKPQQKLSNFRWIIPGRLAASAVPLSMESINHAGVESVISLMPEEQHIFRGSNWRREAEKNGITLHTIPVKDHGAPTERQFRTFLQRMAIAEQHGKKVLIHCVAGVGRTGTMAAGYLIVKHGMTLEQAFAKIRNGLDHAYYDLIARNSRATAEVKRKGIKQYLREHPFQFPESLLQETFLKKVEQRYVTFQQTRKPRKKTKKPDSKKTDQRKTRRRR